MAKERLSACMVLYHSGEDALKAVASLEAADARVDVYIVDNASNDGIAERIKWLHPGVELRLQEKNLGFGRANNVVLPELESDYHLLINPDITFEPDVLTRMVEYMDAHESAVALTPRVLFPDKTEQHLPKLEPTVRYLLGGKLERLGGVFARWRREYTMADKVVRVPVRVHFATGCFMLIRTEVFKQLGGFDKRFFLYQEDSDLSRRISEIGPIIYHPDIVVTHAWHRDSAHSVKATLHHIWSTIQYFTKWGLKW